MASFVTSLWRELHRFINQEIGRELCISGQTVKTHVSYVLLKLGLPDRYELRVYALQQGLVDGEG